MKLSQLVRYLNHLEQNSLPAALDFAVAQAESLMSDIVNHASAFETFNNELQEDFSKIKNSVEQFTANVGSIKQYLHTAIKEQEPQIYNQSQRLYEDEMIYETSQYILSRRLMGSTEQIQALHNKFKLYTDWRVPGLIIRPGLENFIEDLVPLDPLYLVDQNLDLLQPAVEKFDPQYQRRLRQYAIDDRESTQILHCLPGGQFGFVFVNMFFNFKPLPLIHRYLDELYAKLRPGGTLIFTYNDCDLWQGVDLAERNFMCYTPGSKIRAHAESLGFVVESNTVEPANAAWLELRKPGDIQSLRGGQALAKIISK